MNRKENTIALSDIKNIRLEFFEKKKQIIKLAEQMIYQRDLSYIPRIMFCFTVKNYRLSQLNVDMKKLEAICEIIISESMLPGGKLIFLENVNSFDELIMKYTHIILMLRRLEFKFPENILEETIDYLLNGSISICAIRKITDCEIFANPEYVYGQALRIIGGDTN